MNAFKLLLIISMPAMAFQTASAQNCKFEGQILEMGYTQTRSGKTLWAKIDKGNRKYIIAKKAEVQSLLNSAYISRSKICSKSAVAINVTIGNSPSNMKSIAAWKPTELQIFR